MRKSVFIVAAGALLFHAGASAGEVFMCKSYGGGTFWSSAYCSRHNALIERIVSVPDGMPFDQQVKLAEQDRAAAAGLVAQQTPSYVQQAAPTPSNQTACQALGAQIRQWDAMARQPQTPYMQDWITAQRRQARDQQLRLRCCMHGPKLGNSCPPDGLKP